MTESTDLKTAAFNCPNCGAAAMPERTVCRYCGSLTATRMCPACFGSVAAGMKHCPSCGAVVPESNTGRESSLHCPHCETPLMRRLIGPHTLHECAQCGGLWIDKKGFQDICKREEEQEAVLSFRFTKETKSGESRIKRKRAYIPCPECGKLMNHKNFSHCSGIVLDWCRDHGSWLDKRELHEIVAFIRNGGLKKAREGERRKLREETARLRMQRFDLAVRSNRANGLSADMPDLDHPGISLLKLLQETLSD